MNIASGAVIVVLSVIGYFISYTIRLIFIKYKRKKIAKETFNNNLKGDINE
jgi:hypothetical protein